MWCGFKLNYDSQNSPKILTTGSSQKKKFFIGTVCRAFVEAELLMLSTLERFPGVDFKFQISYG